MDGIPAATIATSTNRAVGLQTLPPFNVRPELNFRFDPRYVAVPTDALSMANRSHRSVAVARTRIARPIPIQVAPIFSNTARLSCNMLLIM
jgi:hypothetical protein